MPPPPHPEVNRDLPLPLHPPYARPSHPLAGVRIGEVSNPGPSEADLPVDLTWFLPSTDDESEDGHVADDLDRLNTIANSDGVSVSGDEHFLDDHGNDNDARPVITRSDLTSFYDENLSDGTTRSVFADADDEADDVPYCVATPTRKRKRGRPISLYTEKAIALRLVNQQKRDMTYTPKKRGRPKKKAGHRSAKVVRNEKSKEQRLGLKAAMAKAGEDGFEDSLMPFIDTPAGRKKFPKLSSAVKGNARSDQLAEGCIKLMKSVGSAFKKDAIRLCLGHVEQKNVPVFARLIGMAPDYVTRVLKDRSALDQSALVNQQKAFGFRRASGATNMAAEVICTFFVRDDVSGVFSGAETLTRQISLPMWELRCKFVAEYPRLLRSYIAANEWLILLINSKRETTGTFTRFETSVTSAMAAATQPGFNEEGEVSTRYKEAKAVYLSDLESGRLRHDGWSAEEISTMKRARNAELIEQAKGKCTTVDDEIGAPGSIYVPTEAFFWASIKGGASSGRRIQTPRSANYITKGRSGYWTTTKLWQWKQRLLRALQPTPRRSRTTARKQGSSGETNWRKSPDIERK